MMLRIGSDFKFPFRFSPNVIFPHQPGYSGPAADISLIFQRIRDSGTPIGLVALSMDIFYLFNQHLILLFSPAGFSVNPIVITTSTDSYDTT